MRNTAKFIADEKQKEFDLVTGLLWEDNYSTISYLDSRLKTAGVVIVVFNILLWIVSLIALIFALGKEKKSNLMRIFAIISALFLFALTVAFMYYVWGIAALSASCGFVREINKGNEKVLEEVEIKDDVKAIIKKCFYGTDLNTYSEE